MGWKEYMGYGVLVTVLAGTMYSIVRADRLDFCESRAPKVYELMNPNGLSMQIDCRNEKKDISDVTRE